MKKDRLKCVDFLRGIAIFMVIIVHSPQKISEINEGIKLATKFFETGCQLFFLLSGFCLAMSWYNGSKKIIHFYIKRYFNIAPLYYFSILFYFVLNAVLYHYDAYIGFSQNFSWRPVLNNLLFIHGFLQEGHNNVVPGGWYIGVSMVFYAIFPLAVTILEHIEKKSYIMAVCIPALVYIINELLIFRVIDRTLICFDIDEIVNYRDVLSNLPCFLLGIVIYFAYNEGKIYLLKNRRQLICCFLFLCISLGIAIYSYYFVTILNREFIDGLFFALLFIFIVNIEERIRNWNIFRLISEYGHKSYGIYLSHFLFVWYIMPVLFGATKIFDGYSSVKYVCILVVMLPIIYFTGKIIFIIDTNIQNVLKEVYELKKS